MKNVSSKVACLANDLSLATAHLEVKKKHLDALKVELVQVDSLVQKAHIRAMESEKDGLINHLAKFRESKFSHEFEFFCMLE